MPAPQMTILGAVVAIAASHLWDDFVSEAIDLVDLVDGIVAAITHDDPVESERTQPLHIVCDLRKRASAWLARLERPHLRLVDTKEHLVDEGYIRHRSSS